MTLWNYPWEFPIAKRLLRYPFLLWICGFFSNFETKIGKNPDILGKKAAEIGKKAAKLEKNAANWKNPHFITSRAFEIVSIAIETSIAIASWNLYCYCYCYW